MKIAYFEAAWDAVIIRFFLMMAVIIVGVFAGQYWLAALGLPIFLSAMMAIKITWNEEKTEAKMSQMRPKKQLDKKKAA